MPRQSLAVPPVSKSTLVTTAHGRKTRGVAIDDARGRVMLQVSRRRPVVHMVLAHWCECSSEQIPAPGPRVWCVVVKIEVYAQSCAHCIEQPTFGLRSMVWCGQPDNRQVWESQ